MGILVGPGVIAAACVDGLRAFAARAQCGVVNTWGAKGVFRWDDPHHFGTAGLQARDFELAGLGEVDMLVTSGLDPDEVTSTPWDGRAEVIDVEPRDLARFDRPLPPGSMARPALYTELAAVVEPMYGDPASPPARAAAIAATLPEGGLVVAEPGLVGFWVARTLPTTEAGSVVVPSAGGQRAAWRVAARGVADGRAVVLVAGAQRDEELVGGRVEVWHPDQVDLDPAPLVAVAGAIVAWSDR